MDGRVSAVEIQNSGYAKKEVPAGPLPASGVGEPAWFNYSYADNKFSKGQNWNPCFWGDKMREVDIPSAKTKESRDPKITCQSNLLAIGSALVYMSGGTVHCRPQRYVTTAQFGIDNFCVCRRAESSKCRTQNHLADGLEPVSSWIGKIECYLVSFG